MYKAFTYFLMVFFIFTANLKAQSLELVAQAGARDKSYEAFESVFTNLNQVDVFNSSIIEFNRTTGVFKGLQPGEYSFYFCGSGEGGGITLTVQKVFSGGSTSEGVGIDPLTASIQPKAFIDPTGGPDTSTGVTLYQIFVLALDNITVNQILLQIYFTPTSPGE